MKYESFKHSILFGKGTLEDGKFKGTDTYEDWHLIPSSRPTIAMPGVETKFVTVPGMDGSLDLSQFIRKDRPAFGDRSGSFEFYVENQYDDISKNEFWMTVYPTIVNELHGKKLKMVLREDDPDYYWEGRFTVDRFEPQDGYHSIVSISYQISPFKWRIRNNEEGQIWDNFNFEREYDLGVDEGKILHAKDGYVLIEVSDASDGTKVILTTSSGSEEIPVRRKKAKIIRPIKKATTITLSGEGTMTWRGGSL